MKRRHPTPAPPDARSVRCVRSASTQLIRTVRRGNIIFPLRGFVTNSSRSIKGVRNVVYPDWKLRKASDYLEYDIHTLAAGIGIHFSNRGTEIGNAALDSLLLRARLLLDFFLRDWAEPDDVIAIDFFHDYDPKPYTPRMTKAIKREREKINKRIMHMTIKPMPRLRSHQRYALDKIVPPIVTAFRNWLAVVPDGRLQQPATETRLIFEKHLLRLERYLQLAQTKNEASGV